jgi:hypothetical protein
VPVVQACNPSYSEGRDQEDQGSKPALHKKFLRPYLEKTHQTHTKKVLVEWLKVKALSSNSSTEKTNKQKNQSYYKTKQKYLSGYLLT